MTSTSTHPTDTTPGTVPESEPGSTVEALLREADHARDRINDAVAEMRDRLGLAPDAEDAHGPFAPVRRHPFTVAVAAAGAVTATVVTVAVTRGHRRSEARSVRDLARRIRPRRSKLRRLVGR
ncbi:hypothetical protein [Glycomyces sp. NPDC047010]|uniref:hypothetical protein n=1 Tax=Glycomyces sp. NPDC047010 TaxID=3155023 RepID=UPI0033EAE398